MGVSSKSNILKKIIEYYVCFRKGNRNIHSFLFCLGLGLGTNVVWGPESHRKAKGGQPGSYRVFQVRGREEGQKGATEEGIRPSSGRFPEGNFG